MSIFCRWTSYSLIMTERPLPSNNTDSPDLGGELQRLTIMWGACCISPVLYLGAAWVIRRYFMDDGDGYFPLSADGWSTALIALVVLLVTLQGVHLLIRYRFRDRLAAARSSTEEFIQILTRRTLFLIFVSECAVFAGFCLFLLQGEHAPVFGAGLVAMFLYAQSHPRSGLPV
jgi:hypothetical protein